VPITFSSIATSDVEYRELRLCGSVDIANPATENNDSLAICSQDSGMSRPWIDGCCSSSNGQIRLGGLGLLHANERPTLFRQGEECNLRHVDECSTGVTTDQEEILLLRLSAIAAVGEGGLQSGY
jgi:hypothetical protein